LKKVRAKVTISPHFETSARESDGERRAEGAQAEEKGRKRRRVATKAEGDGTAKWAVLSLVSYLKYNFFKINFPFHYKLISQNYEQTKIFSLRSQINRGR
jgi:hypothetical protein